MLIVCTDLVYDPHSYQNSQTSKAFWKMLEFYERKGFFGVPENTLDHIYTASQEIH